MKPYSVLPALGVRDVVFMPYNISELKVGRPMSIQALLKAVQTDNKLLLIFQKENTQNAPDALDFFPCGVVVQVSKLRELADGTLEFRFVGLDRANLISLNCDEGFWQATYNEITLEDKDAKDPKVRQDINALVNTIRPLFRGVSFEIASRLEEAAQKSESEVLDWIVGNLYTLGADGIVHSDDYRDLQCQFLSKTSLSGRLDLLHKIMTSLKL